MSKTLVAHLPAMSAEDLSRFESEGGVWGHQRAIRRRQVWCMGATGWCAALGGAWWVRVVRRNTLLVLLGTFPVFFTFGLVVGNGVGNLIFPSVADNGETSMMRRTWWAKECSKNWDPKQVDLDGIWHANSSE